jgi:hypothetical protein
VSWSDEAVVGVVLEAAGAWADAIIVDAEMTAPAVAAAMANDDLLMPCNVRLQRSGLHATSTAGVISFLA